MGLLHNKYARRALAAAGLLVLTLLVAGPAWTVPLEVYGRLPSVEEVALSPDGSRLAIIRTSMDKRMLFLLSLVEHKLIDKPILVGNAKLRSIDWADNDHLMIVSSRTALPVGLIGREDEWSLLSV